MIAKHSFFDVPADKFDKIPYEMIEDDGITWKTAYFDKDGVEGDFFGSRIEITWFKEV